MKQLEDERRELIRSRLIALGREVPEDVDLLDIPLDSELESDLESRCVRVRVCVVNVEHL